jgi:hypothetical protein
MVILLLLLPQSKLPPDTEHRKAIDKLLKDPKDPDANLVAGKFLAFVEGDYKLGLTYLSNSNDATLKVLGEHEIDPAHTDTAPKKVGMGDEWVAAAKKYLGNTPFLGKAPKSRSIRFWVESQTESYY